MEEKRNMSRKMLFLDLDGTLLNDSKEVTQKNDRAISRAVEAGHIVTIATGRPLSSSVAIARKLGMTKEGNYLICFNGAVIYDMAEEKIVAEEVLDLPLVELLFEEAEKAGIYIHTYSHKKVLARRVTPELLQYKRITGQDYEVNEEFPKGIQPPNKVLLSDLSLSGKLEKFQEGHRWLEEGRCRSLFSCSEYLEYNPITSSKGIAIQKMADLFGIAIKDTIAVGDEQNDISMIQAAGIGVAMKNGKPQVKEIADYVTKRDNNEDAIDEVITKFIL